MQDTTMKSLDKREANSWRFLSLKERSNSPLCIDKMMGFLCIVMKGWDREYGE